MPAYHREETVLCLVETRASAEEKTSYPAVMLDGDGDLPTCFDFRRSRGACS